LVARRITKKLERVDYHRAELRIALDPNHPAHLLPPQLPLSNRVLDIGCGAGQTLIGAYPDRVSYGLDPNLEALKLGKSLTDRVCFVCGKAESLPFPNNHFDMVIARVSLPYTNVGVSLREIHRVLRRDGKLWITLQNFSRRWRQARSQNYKGWIFFAYVLLNSALFHVTQKLVPFWGRYDSFQTERGISRALIKNGFREISISRDKFFLVTARSD
jgi:ubiquinone/menaquinone biosynthesis C-methylase UbiE